MAELGNLFVDTTPSSTKDFNIDVEMLDYNFVNDCKDWKQLNAIVDVLKSGKEGYYPDLIRVAEERLVDLLPSKQRKRYLSLNHKTTPAEIADAESELYHWRKRMTQKDETLLQQRESTERQTSSKLPPVRGSGGASIKYNDKKSDNNLEFLLPPTFQEYEELLKLLNTSQRKKFQELYSELQVQSYTEVKRGHRAELEKTKGNESFRVADNKDAVACYSKSLAYNPLSAVVWANRAMAYIRLELFDLAEADSSVALFLDPAYVKAYSRRGLVRFKRGKYAEAVRDFDFALQLDPKNVELSKLLQTAREKHLEVEGVSAEEAEALAKTTKDVCLVSQDCRHNVDMEVDAACENVQSSESLLMPPIFGACELLAEGTLQVQSSGFVRINVVSDDDSDEDSDSAEEIEEISTAGFSRVVIAEASDSEGDEIGESTSIGRAESCKEQGNELMRQGKVIEAVQAYSDSLQAHPGFIASLNNRAQAYLALKRYDEVIADCSAVLRAEPNNLKALYRRASAAAAIESRDYKSMAITDLDVMLSIEPQNSLALRLQAQLQDTAPTFGTIDVQKLKQQAQQLLGDGLNDRVIILLAQYLRGVDEPPFSELLQSDRTSLLHLLATAYASIQDYDHAVAVHENILRIDPTNFRALFKRAEGQLQLAIKAEGDSKTKALVLAENDIEAALRHQRESPEVLSLRQKLLKLRNTVPAVEHKGTPTIGSRQQSDAEKEKGNQAMTNKHYVNAVLHYSNSIAFDTTNLAAYNNRALAYMKQFQFPLAEADATVVINSTNRSSSAPDHIDTVQTLRLKALCRRAQARKAVAEALLQSSSLGEVASSAQSKLRDAVVDLQELLRDDPANKTALTELKMAKQLLTQCEDALCSIETIGQSTTKVPPSSVPSTSTPAAPRSRSFQAPAGSSPPRADMQRISAMLGSAVDGSSPAFVDIGLVARSSKKLGSIESTNCVTALSTSTNASANVSTPSGKKTADVQSSSKKSTTKSPPPSIVLTAAPADPPKTVYEFERVWRGLKTRPDLFAQYIACFKKSTYRKVLKEAVSPDLVSYMWRCVRDHAVGSQERLKALSGFSEASNFRLTLSLLPAEDLQCICDVFVQLDTHAATMSEPEMRSKFLKSVVELKEIYGVCA